MFKMKANGKSNFLQFHLEKDRIEGAKAIIIDPNSSYYKCYSKEGDKILEVPKFELNIYKFKKEILNWIYKNNDISWLFIKCDENEAKMLFQMLEEDMNKFNNKYRSNSLKFYNIN